jgi:uncharacterized protein (DUF1697 family)
VPRFIALLRAVNLAGHNKVGMRDLCALLDEIGYLEPRSLLQSGNLVFGSAKGSPAAFEAKLEVEAKRGLGLETAFFVRDAKQWHAAIAGNPFADAARDDPSHLVLLACKDAPGAKAAAALKAAIKGRETFAVRGREVYMIYPDGIGRSKVTSALIERHLGTRVTGRNWNTVLKLGALLEA